jgi:hypothetical protein
MFRPFIAKIWKKGRLVVKKSKNCLFLNNKYCQKVKKSKNTNFYKKNFSKSQKIRIFIKKILAKSQKVKNLGF